MKETTNNQINTVEHIFALMKWMKKHPNFNFYGVSATVSRNVCEQKSMCLFTCLENCLPGSLFIEVDNVKKTVFIATSIPIKYYL